MQYVIFSKFVFTIKYIYCYTCFNELLYDLLGLYIYIYIYIYIYKYKYNYNNYNNLVDN